MICRICKGYAAQESTNTMVRFATRHNVHVKCAVEKWGWDEFVCRVSRYQLFRIPWMLAKELGIYDHLVAMQESQITPSQGNN